MAPGSMGEFWDARAAEDAFYFVDSRQRYRDPDPERFWRGGEEALELVRERLGFEVGAGQSVVEIGCGVGRITRALAARADRVAALDVSARMLEIAARENPDLANVTWIRGDGTSLRPLPDADADAAISLLVFQHLPDPELTLGYVRELGRVLRPGGCAALQLSNDLAVHRRPRGLGRAARLLRARLPWRPRGQTDPAWLGSAVELGRLRATVAESGMELERLEGEGTQYCMVRLRRVAGLAPVPPHSIGIS